jgi:hypothetical protein
MGGKFVFQSCLAYYMEKNKDYLQNLLELKSLLLTSIYDVILSGRFALSDHGSVLMALDF